MQKLFEKFEIIEILKKDDHSTVYLANHVFLGKKIILKTLDTDKITDLAILNRFKREAKILAKLEHPNIIKVLDFGTYQNYFYLSFEYFLSKNLREHLKDQRMTDSQKESLFIQLLKALNAAHSAKIIHRDLKPENILINDSLQLKMADFGLAIEQDENLLTNKSSIVGTPAYMSPEQIKGEKLTQQSDLFSLGIVLHELYSGKNPFLGKDVSETINNILSFDEKKIVENLKEADDKIILFIQKMLQKDSKKRATIEDLFNDLNLPVEIETNDSKTVRNNSIKYIFSIASIIALLFAVIFILDYYKEAPIENDENVNKTMIEPKQDTIRQEKIETEQEAITTVGKDTIPKVMKPVKNVESQQTKNIPDQSAQIQIQCLPWAKIFIDSVEVQDIDGFISLKAGSHRLELKNPGYPNYSEELILMPGEISYYKVNLDTLFGFLNCNVFPWGEVFIDGVHIGQTPFFKPVMLNPGTHSVSIHNPEFETINREIAVARMETLQFKINLQAVN